MTWFLTRGEAEALLATIPRNPDWTYSVVPNAGGPEAWAIMVIDADGMLVTESYSPGDVFPLHQEKPPPVSEAEYRDLERTHPTRREGEP